MSEAGTWHTVGELNFELEETAFPDGLVAAGDRTVPAFEVETALLVLHGPSHEAEGVIFAPLLAVTVSVIDP